MPKIVEYTILMVLCFCIMVFKEITGKPSEPVALYLHTKARTWNEANHKCREENSRLVTLKDSTKVQALRVVVKEWKARYLINDDLWMGMFYTDTGRYNWTDCSSVGTWTLWYYDEPNSQTKHRCIRVDHSNLSWKTINCDRSYQFICEKQLEKCWFDTFTHKRITGSLVSAGLMDLAGCENHCLTKDALHVECAAFTFTENNECLVLIRDKPYLESESLPAMKFNLSSVSAIKRCFFYDYSTYSDMTYRDTNPFPGYTCSAPPSQDRVSSSSTLITQSSTPSQASTPGCSCDCYPSTFTPDPLPVPSTDVPSGLSIPISISPPIGISVPVTVSEPINVSPITSISTHVSISPTLSNSQTVSIYSTVSSSPKVSNSPTVNITQTVNISPTVNNSPTVNTSPTVNSSPTVNISPIVNIFPSSSVPDSLMNSDSPVDRDSSTMSCASWVELETSMTEQTELATSSLYSPECTFMEEASSAKGGTTSYTNGLILNRISLSSYRRKMTSAVDSRTSAVVIGSIGCLNIALFFVILLILDATNLIQLAHYVVNNWFK
ncbi:uncharacterized protein LOC121384336 [Gigantopelta aegis]|uniref:uncharacterized protein LOC121384336 n=1 Tax=Gigantopelta aegis TaxID=1735272 RepID=UPI001B88E212|nr:uncharacterized protein LOC121384336 [Gigantopelta aegis]